MLQENTNYGVARDQMIAVGLRGFHLKMDKKNHSKHEKHAAGGQSLSCVKVVKRSFFFRCPPKGGEMEACKVGTRPFSAALRNLRSQGPLKGREELFYYDSIACLRREAHP